MDGVYDIFRGGEKIGKAEVRRQGLYYQFKCWCDLTGTVIYRVTVSCAGQIHNLGILAPEGDCYCVKAKLPVSRFQGDAPMFAAVPRHPEIQGLWVPLCPEEPFAYLSRLEQAVLERRGEQTGLRFPTAQ